MARKDFTLRVKNSDGSYSDLHPKTNVQQVEGAYYPGPNDNWWVDGADTGVPIRRSPDELSAAINKASIAEGFQPTDVGLVTGLGVGITGLTPTPTHYVPIPYKPESLARAGHVFIGWTSPNFTGTTPSSGGTIEWAGGGWPGSPAISNNQLAQGGGSVIPATQSTPTLTASWQKVEEIGNPDPTPPFDPNFPQGWDTNVSIVNTLAGIAPNRWRINGAFRFDTPNQTTSGNLRDTILSSHPDITIGTLELEGMPIDSFYPWPYDQFISQSWSGTSLIMIVRQGGDVRTIELSLASIMLPTGISLASSTQHPIIPNPVRRVRFLLSENQQNFPGGSAPWSQVPDAFEGIEIKQALEPWRILTGTALRLPHMPVDINPPPGMKFGGWRPGLGNFKGTNRGREPAGSSIAIYIDTDFYATWVSASPTANLVYFNNGGGTGTLPSGVVSESRKRISPTRATIAATWFQSYVPFITYISGSDTVQLSNGIYYIANAEIIVNLAGLSAESLYEKGIAYPSPPFPTWQQHNYGENFYRESNAVKVTTQYRPVSGSSKFEPSFEHLIVLTGVTVNVKKIEEPSLIGNPSSTTNSRTRQVYGYRVWL